jgi:hypothetical protein
LRLRPREVLYGEILRLFGFGVPDAFNCVMVSRA